MFDSNLDTTRNTKKVKLRFIESVSPKSCQNLMLNILSWYWPTEFRDGKLKGFKKQSVKASAENTFNSAELCQGQIMASISHFGFDVNSKTTEDNFEGFFEESSGWATVSNWLERQVEILNNSVLMKCSTFDNISTKIREFSLNVVRRNLLNFWSHSEMDFKLNENSPEPELTTILPNGFIILPLSHLWTKTIRGRPVTFHRCLLTISFLRHMIQGLIWQLVVISALKLEIQSEMDKHLFIYWNPHGNAKYLLCSLPFFDLRFYYNFAFWQIWV